jgi:hypothetical protein
VFRPEPPPAGRRPGEVSRGADGPRSDELGPLRGLDNLARRGNLGKIAINEWAMQMLTVYCYEIMRPREDDAARAIIVSRLVIPHSDATGAAAAGHPGFVDASSFDLPDSFPEAPVELSAFPGTSPPLVVAPRYEAFQLETGQTLLFFIVPKLETEESAIVGKVLCVRFA